MAENGSAKDNLLTYRWLGGILFALLLSLGGFLANIMLSESRAGTTALLHRLIILEEQVRVNTGRLNSYGERLIVLEWYQKQTEKRLEELEKWRAARDAAGWYAK